MASAHYLVSLPDLDISNPRKTSMVRASSSSSTKNTTSSFLPLAFASSIPIKACKISFLKRSRKFAIKATENLPNSEATLAADAFSKFKHMLLPVTDRNPYLSEGTRQNAHHFEPNTALCKVSNNDSLYTVRCCVKGSLLEVNDRLIKQPELLNTSAAREGYIAIMMPKPTDWLKVRGQLLNLEEFMKLRDLC